MQRNVKVNDNNNINKLHINISINKIVQFLTDELKVSEHIKNNPFAKIGDDIFGSSKSILRQSRLQFTSVLKAPSIPTSPSSAASTSKDNLFASTLTNGLNRNAIQCKFFVIHFEFEYLY